MISFFVFGHKNILATHRNTIEFTKDPEVTVRGDCIVGVNADFDCEQIMLFLKNSKRIKVTIQTSKIVDSFLCTTNQLFEDSHELVFRKSEYLSKRTLGIRADKAAIDLDRTLIKYLKDPKNKAKVTLNEEKITE